MSAIREDILVVVPEAAWLMEIITGSEQLPDLQELDGLPQLDDLKGLSVPALHAALTKARKTDVWQPFDMEYRPEHELVRILFTANGLGLALVMWHHKGRPGHLRAVSLTPPTPLTRWEETPDPTWSSGDHPAIDELVRTVREEERIPGLAVAIRRGGQELHTACAGVADSGSGMQPVLPATEFRAACITKVLTALTVLDLVDRGALALDDEANEHLTSHRLVQPHGTAPPSVRHLLTHTAGFPAAATPSYEIICVTAPGERRVYTDTSYALVADVVSTASRRPFAHWAAETFLEPLGMSPARLDGSGGGLVGFGSGFGFIWPGRQPTLLEGAADLLASVGDIARLGEEVIRHPEMRVPQWQRGIPAATGLGMRISRIGDRQVLVRDGGIADLWETIIVIDPTDGTVLAAAANTHRDALWRLAQQALDAVS